MSSISRGIHLFMKKDRTNHCQKWMKPFYKPKTSNQIKYMNFLNDHNISLVFGIGSAGTGKTALACNTAIKSLNTGTIRNIVLTRPIQNIDELGFLPGTINKKMDPWIRPMLDVFSEYYSANEIERMLADNTIEICPLAFMRGRTFKNSFIIADEMQNCSPEQMKMVNTRLGENSKMVITGDLTQIDNTKTKSGLEDILNKIKNYHTEIEQIKIVNFDNTDVVRSPFVSTLLDIYDYKKRENTQDCALIPKHLDKTWEL